MSISGRATFEGRGGSFHEWLLVFENEEYWDGLIR